MEHCYIETPIGIAKIMGNANGIASVTISNKHKVTSQVIPESLANCTSQLRAYFNNQLDTFNLKLQLEGTAFQKRVWNALLNIPFGKTISYQDLSKQLGNTKAIRAVANANAKNPLWVIIPCHRVIGSDGSLTGYAGGLYRKQWLLNHESKYKQQTLF